MGVCRNACDGNHVGSLISAGLMPTLVTAGVRLTSVLASSHGGHRVWASSCLEAQAWRSSGCVYRLEEKIEHRTWYPLTQTYRKCRRLVRVCGKAVKTESHAARLRIHEFIVSPAIATIWAPPTWAPLLTAGILCNG